MSEEDRDQRLARLIGEHLEKGTPDDEEVGGSDPEEKAFYQALLDVKHQARSEAGSPAADTSRRIWNRIDATVKEPEITRKPDRSPVRAGHRRLPGRRWSWAAAVATMFAAGLIAILLLRAPTATLVASAHDDILDYVAADGTLVSLRPNSQLYLIEDGEALSHYRLTGEGYFAVRQQAHRVFTVDGGDARVTVLGTRFNFNTWSDEASVYLEEGRVLFEHRHSGASTVLEPGQSSRTTSVGNIQDPEQDTGEEHLDWLAGEMLFRRQSVHLILSELEHHFGITLRVPQDFRDETLTGRILLREKRQSLDDLGLTLGGHFIEIQPETYRFDPD